MYRRFEVWGTRREDTVLETLTKWEDNIKMDVLELEWAKVDWIQLSQNRQN